MREGGRGETNNKHLEQLRVVVLECAFVDCLKWRESNMGKEREREGGGRWLTYGAIYMVPSYQLETYVTVESITICTHELCDLVAIRTPGL